MAMGRRRDRARAPGLWIATNELPGTAGHPINRRRKQLLDAHGFDAFVDDQCTAFYATRGGGDRAWRQGCTCGCCWLAT